MCNATDRRVALVGIILQNGENVSDQVNSILTEYGEFIIGRMGLPYRERNLNVISVVVDAPNDTISALCGKLGMVSGISVKTIYAKATA